MVVVDQQVGGGAGGGVVGQPHHQVDQRQAGQAVQGVENYQGRSIENSAEFGDVAQYRELNAIGTGEQKNHNARQHCHHDDKQHQFKIRVFTSYNTIPGLVSFYHCHFCASV